MSITTYISNYHDDYVTSNNGDKNYLRILFKPGYSVQVRELNQLQSALQDQINRLGSSIWNKDVAVLGGKASFLSTVYSIKLNLAATGFDQSASTIAEYAKTIIDPTGLRGEVLGYKLISGAVYQFYYTYTNSGNDGSTAFSTDIARQYTIIFKSDDSTLAESALPSVTNATLADTDSLGYASAVVCESGVFFTKGSFVAVPIQTIFLDKTDDDELFTGYAALEINENIVSYSSDNSLLDNANGTPNYSAPGADRYQIDLSLAWITKADYESAENTAEYIKLLYINGSRPEEIALGDEYSDINNILAKRTSEESGNYTVNPFGIQIRELYDGDALPVNCIVPGLTYKIQSLGTTPSATWTSLGAGESPVVGTEFVASSFNASAISTDGLVSEIAYRYGVYKANDLDVVDYDISTTALKKSAIVDAKTRYNLTLEPSVAYVDGYRVNLDRSLNINASKARESEKFRFNISANFGGYFIGNVAESYLLKLPVLSTVSNTYVLKTATDDELGTCKIRALEPTGASLTEFRCYVYDIKFNGASRFDLVDQIDGNNFFFDVTSESILQVGNTSSVFPLPYSAARSLEDVTFYAQQYFTGSAGSSGAIVLNAADNTVFTDPDDVVVLVDNAVRASTTYTAILSADAKTISITPIGIAWDEGDEHDGLAWDEGDEYDITAQVQVIDANAVARVTKSIDTVTDNILVSNGPNNVFYLSKTDIIKIKSVTYDSNDITSQFELFDDGQRDTHYTNGRIRYIGTAALTGTATINVQYEYYKRFGEDINSRRAVMYTVDSYSSNNNSVGTQYENIPSYKGIRLSDVIDFRHDLVYSVIDGALGALIINQNKLVIDPNTPVSAQVSLYLPRVDKVVVNSRGQFSIVQGVPALDPVEPASPKDAMTLYTLEVPAYTANVNDIVKNYVDNRRYTMRDIGAIEKRISNIEYYTSLSLLERSANDKPIFDDAGERFKNGILVDNFIGHGVGDVFDKAYSCSIDRGNNILRPRYNTNNIDLVIDSEIVGVNTATKTVDGGNIRVHDSLITLNYSEVELVSHLKATDHISVHPHIYSKINGSIRLSPSVDNWKDTATRPDVIVQDDGAFDAIQFIAEDPALDILGTDWNNWERSWGGISTTTRPIRVRNGRRTRAGVETATNQSFIDTRTGTNTTLGSINVERSLGENVVETAIIPFIRSRRVYFYATGLKANTRVYAYFDGKDITGYTNQVTNNDPSKFIVPTTINDNATDVFTDVAPDSLVPPPGYNAYGDLITDSSGQLYGSFIIPNNDSLRFNTGERQFKLTDDIRNGSSETSFASATYVASGILETVQETILSTKTPQFNVEQLSETFSGISTTTTTRWHDPIAQSFLIDSNEFPEGAFITSVDLYFQRKALTDSVEVYIVTMENGAPTQVVVPYSRKSLNPNEVAVSDTGAAATNFKFNDPVYLKADEEYVLVVSSNSGDYRCWYATLGNVDISTGKRIEKQEYLGTFFTSANTSTWTPQQEQDLKFRINRANFVTTPSTIDFRTTLHTGIDKITVTASGSGYSVVPTVEITGGNGTGATAVATLNPVNNTVSSIRITNRGSGYTSPPNINIVGGLVGGGSPPDPDKATATATLAEVPVSVYNLRQPNLLFNSAQINHTIQFGNETPIQIEKGINNYIPSEYSRLNSHVLSAIGQTIPAGPRAIIKSRLLTRNSKISPVIDIDGSSLLTITNIINNTNVNETTPGSGAAVARYITRKVDLNDSSDLLNVYIGANRPTANTNIAVYVKVGFDTSTPFDSVDWVELTPTTPLAINSDTSSYSEAEYIYDPADDFISFQVKIVMLSNNIFDIPTIRDFRAIATI
jgi:hypothetical protein